MIARRRRALRAVPRLTPLTPATVARSRSTASHRAAPVAIGGRQVLDVEGQALSADQSRKIAAACSAGKAGATRVFSGANGETSNVEMKKVFGPDGSMSSAEEMAAAAAEVKRCLRQLGSLKSVWISGRVGRQASRMGRYERNTALPNINSCPVFTQVPVAKEPAATFAARSAALMDPEATIDPELLTASITHLFKGRNGKWFVGKTERMEIGKSSGWLRTSEVANSPLGLEWQWSTSDGGWDVDSAIALTPIRTEAEQAKEDAGEAKETAAAAEAAAVAPPAPPAAEAAAKEEEEEEDDDDAMPSIDAVLDEAEGDADEADGVAGAKTLGSAQTLVFTECNNCKYTIDGPFVTKIYIAQCTDLTLVLPPTLKILASTVEAFRSSRINLVVGTPVGTMQIEQCADVNIVYHEEAWTKDTQVVWAGVKHLIVRYGKQPGDDGFGDSGVGAAEEEITTRKGALKAKKAAKKNDPRRHMVRRVRWCWVAPSLHAGSHLRLALPLRSSPLPSPPGAPRTDHRGLRDRSFARRDAQRRALAVPDQARPRSLRIDEDRPPRKRLSVDEEGRTELRPRPGGQCRKDREEDGDYDQAGRRVYRSAGQAERAVPVRQRAEVQEVLPRVRAA